MKLLAFTMLMFTACGVDDDIDADLDDDGLDDIVQADTANPILRGVDRAGAFTVAEARVLNRDHGVRWTGVYIGGACSAGSGWTRDRVEAIARATDWTFMPIWVGQQSSSICGSHTLTYQRGIDDGEAAARRMKAMGWRADQKIPIALDVEGGTYDAAPHGTTAYVRGFVRAAHLAGYRAYVYSSERGIEHFHDARLHLDGAWIANWHYNGFHRNSNPHNVHIGQRFTGHNRAWQYAGDFHVAGAGNIDANVSDLPLAPAPGGSNL